MRHTRCTRGAAKAAPPGGGSRQSGAAFSGLGGDGRLMHRELSVQAAERAVADIDVDGARLDDELLRRVLVVGIGRLELVPLVGGEAVSAGERVPEPGERLLAGARLGSPGRRRPAGGRRVGCCGDSRGRSCPPPTGRDRCPPGLTPARRWSDPAASRQAAGNGRAGSPAGTADAAGSWLRGRRSGRPGAGTGRSRARPRPRR